MTVPITIVIAAHGRADVLARTLRSLARCAFPESYRETIVIENGDRCGIEEAVASFPDELKFRYMYTPKPGKSHALNCVLDDLDEGFVFFSDDDVRYSAEILQAYIKAIDGTDGRAFYGGPIGVDYEEQPPEWLLRYLPRSAKGWKLNATQVCEFTEQCFLGFNWGAFTSDLRKIGGFDERFGPGSQTKATGQEHDAQRRLLQAGVSAYYVPSAMVWHYVPVERCTENWIVERGHRLGVNFGIQFAARFPTALTLPAAHAHILFWSVHELLASLTTSQALQFRGRYKKSAWRGFVRGQRLAKSQRMDEGRRAQ